MPRLPEVDVGVARHDLAERQPEPFLQPRRELHAMRDRMVEAHLDELFRHGHGDEALRGLPRHAELLRDLVLRVAGDVIEPAGARRIVEPDVRLAAARLVPDLPNIVCQARISCPEPAASLDRPERLRHLTHGAKELDAPARPARRRLRRVEMAAADEAPDLHAGILRRQNARPRCPRSPGILRARPRTRGRRAGRGQAPACRSPPSRRKRSCRGTAGRARSTSSDIVARAMLLLVAMQ